MMMEGEKGRKKKKNTKKTKKNTYIHTYNKDRKSLNCWLSEGGNKVEDPKQERGKKKKK